MKEFVSNPAEAMRPGDDPLATLSALDAVVYDWDLATDRIAWGPNCEATLRGLPLEALTTGEGYAALTTADSEVSRYAAVCEGPAVDAGPGAAFRAIYRLAAPGGEALTVEDFGRWFADADGRPRRAHGLVRVLARGASARDDVSDIALMSRRSFNAWVDARSAEPAAPARTRALMVVGVGGLAEINRHHGYDVADELILGVGRRLARRLRGGDRMVRYSGGKYALFVTLGPNDAPGVAAERILGRVNDEPYPTSAGSMLAESRIGVAITPRHGRNAHLLLQRADEAYGLACDGGEGVVVYEADEALAEARRREAWVADEIVAALNERRIVLAFQPIVPNRPDLPLLEEALVRLRLEDGGVLRPDALMPTAEKLGLAPLIDERVLELTVQRLAEHPERRISMNVSILTLRSPHWLQSLRDRLGQAPRLAQRLVVEITETQAVGDVSEILKTLNAMKALGVRVAMDDFGAGHTSFRNLRTLGVDIVKIDGAFVQNLATSIDDRFFVRTLAALARHLGILTVAEWVEDEESARLLRDWDVDYLQGHYLGRAETPLETLPLLRAAAS